MLSMLSVVGILLGLALLIFLALRGWNVVLASLLSSLVVVVFSAVSTLDTLYGAYMTGFINWAGKFYPMLAAGAVFAKLMEDSGAAKSISNFIMSVTGKDSAHKVFIGIWIVTSLFVYAGINTWVIVFVMVPIMYPIFKELNLPWHIALGVFALGANGVANYLPGSVTVFNIMPMKYLDTSSIAGWKISMFSDIFCVAIGFWYIFRELKKSQARGEQFIQPSTINVKPLADNNLPGAVVSFLPIVVTLIVLNVLKKDVFFALAAGCAVCIVLMYKHFAKLLSTLNDGAVNVAVPVVNTCAVIGFGSVVANVSGFEIITNFIMNGIPGSPYISWIISINALAGITGSASGGLGIAMESLLPKYAELGLNPEALHRLAALASCGLDNLPHNGSVVTILSIFGLTHKEGYRHYFWTCVVFPALSCIPALLAAFLFY